MRLFVGLVIPADVRAVLCTLCSGIFGARWVRPENMHLTLRFIGETDGGSATDLDIMLGDVDGLAFEMALTGVGHFSSKSRLRSIWVGIEAGNALEQLHAKVEMAVQRAGFKQVGRKFKPHVTLARFKGEARAVDLSRYLEANGTFTTKPFWVDALTLFESHLAHKGAHYVALKEYPLLRKKIAFVNSCS